MPNEETYDVAISFLSTDSDTAVSIARKLTSLRVFCFPRNQEELAGTDGMASFRAAFRHQSTIQVVLFRAGWGETSWTGVEQTAIQEACLEKGWRGLFFVALEEAERRNWVPDTEIHFNLSVYSLDELVGAIKARAQELGAEIRRETPIERARRAQARAEFETETRQLFRGYEGVNLARAEAVVVCDQLESAIREAVGELPAEIRVARRIQHSISWTAPTAGLQVTFNSSVNMLENDSGLEVALFKHELALPGENRHYVNPNLPKRHRQDRYKVRRTMELGMCWETHDGSLLGSNSLADRILNDYWSVYEESIVNPLQIDW